VSVEYWANETCPKCKKRNYAYTGSSDDDGTDPDYHGVKCWNCKHEWLFDGVQEEFDLMEYTVNDAYLADGQKSRS